MELAGEHWAVGQVDDVLSVVGGEVCTDEVDWGSACG